MKQKTTDPLIDEIHRTRREISDRFNGDITAIAEDAARRQAASNRPVWQPSATDEVVYSDGDGECIGNAGSPAATG